jgi:hypothetical protein
MMPVAGGAVTHGTRINVDLMLVMVVSAPEAMESSG